MALTFRISFWRLSLAVLALVGAPSWVKAEGSSQVGLNQGLRDDTVLRVDVLSPDELIHIAARSNDGSPVSVNVINPLGVQSSYDLVPGAGALPAQLPSSICDALVVRTNLIGVWQVQFVTSGSLPAWQRTLMPFDVTVAKPETSCVDPRRSALGGRVHSLDIHLRALGFDRSNATNADFFVLSTASGSSNGAVWLLDFEGLAGWDYHVAASRSGLLPPYSYTSRRSSITPAPTTEGELPVYLQFPAVVDFSSDRPQVSAPPLVGASTGIAGRGADIKFFASFATTYQVALDINNDGKFEPSQGDVSLSGTASAGENLVRWDGRLADGSDVAPRSAAIPVRITLRTGEFHFAGYDIETARPGLAVYALDGPGALKEAQMHWDDRPVLSGDVTRDPNPTHTLEEGISSSTHRHGWGDFTAREPGDNSYIDTWVTRDEASVDLTLPWLAAESDLDGDGLENGVERQLGTYHDDVDTDGDGVSDFLEALPLDAPPDSDGDGVIDALDADGFRSTSGDLEPNDAGPADAGPLVSPSGLTPAPKAQEDSTRRAEEPSAPETSADAGANAFAGSQARDPQNRTAIGPAPREGDVAALDDPPPELVLGGATCRAASGSRSDFGLHALFLVALALLRRHRRKLVVLSPLLFVPAAHAEAGVRVDQYRAAPGAFDGFVLPNLAPPSDRELQARLDLSYAKAPLVLETGDDEATRTELVSDEVRAQLSGAFALQDLWLFYLGADAILTMVGDGDDELSADGAALGDLRAGFRLQGKVRSNSPAKFGFASELTLPASRWADRQQHFAGERGPTLSPALLTQVDLGPVRFGGNLGARLRGPRELGPLSLGSEFTGAAGISVSPRTPLRISLEAFAARPLLARASRGTSPVEILLGVQLTMAHTVISGAVGAGLGDGYGAPSLRVLWNVSYAPQNDADRDGDGLIDPRDLCPAQAEDRDKFEDGDGCPDRDDDRDSIPDERDAARLDPEDHDGFLDEDGIPDPDNDLDGVLHGRDGAPVVAEDLDGFEDLDGIPERDDDADGVTDQEDLCPRTSGLPIDRGCPSRRVRTSEFPVQLPVVEFAEDSDLLLVQAAEALESLRVFLVNHPEVRVARIEGHADARHESAYNLDLSLRRALRVRAFLEERGIDPKRLEAYGCGETRPIDDNQVELGRARNRRAELHVVLPQTSLGRSTRGCVGISETKMTSNAWR